MGNGRGAEETSTGKRVCPRHGDTSEGPVPQVQHPPCVAVRLLPMTPPLTVFNTPFRVPRIHRRHDAPMGRRPIHQIPYARLTHRPPPLLEGDSRRVIRPVLLALVYFLPIALSGIMFLVFRATAR